MPNDKFKTHRTSTILLGILMLPFNLAHGGYEEGVSAALAGDYGTAFKEFSASAETGLDMAQYNLGILYFTGRGTQKDLQQAFYWTQKAAEQGHAGAQFNLAALYAEGQGVKQDDAVAFRWYHLAATGGHGEARYTLATLYQEGKGVEQDLPRAHAWARLAAEDEVEDAADLQVQIEKSLSAEQLSAARRAYARIQIGQE